MMKLLSLSISLIALIMTTTAKSDYNTSATIEQLTPDWAIQFNIVNSSNSVPIRSFSIDLSRAAPLVIDWYDNASIPIAQNLDTNNDGKSSNIITWLPPSNLQPGDSYLTSLDIDGNALPTPEKTDLIITYSDGNIQRLPFGGVSPNWNLSYSDTENKGTFIDGSGTFTARWKIPTQLVNGDPLPQNHIEKYLLYWQKDSNISQCSDDGPTSDTDPCFENIISIDPNSTAQSATFTANDDFRLYVAMATKVIEHEKYNRYSKLTLPVSKFYELETTVINPPTEPPIDPPTGTDLNITPLWYQTGDNVIDMYSRWPAADAIYYTYKLDPKPQYPDTLALMINNYIDPLQDKNGDGFLSPYAPPELQRPDNLDKSHYEWRAGSTIALFVLMCEEYSAVKSQHSATCERSVNFLEDHTWDKWIYPNRLTKGPPARNNITHESATANLGRIIQMAIALYEATGKQKYLTWINNVGNGLVKNLQPSPHGLYFGVSWSYNQNATDISHANDAMAGLQLAFDKGYDLGGVLSEQTLIDIANHTEKVIIKNGAISGYTDGTDGSLSSESWNIGAWIRYGKYNSALHTKLVAKIPNINNSWPFIQAQAKVSQLWVDNGGVLPPPANDPVSPDGPSDVQITVEITCTSDDNVSCEFKQVN